IRKMLEEKRNESLIGERILEIDGENIRIISDSGENIIYIKSIKNIIENDEYIFIYINSISAIIIPIKVFKSIEDKELFKSLLN
ncbi:YcxB family protein, partial [Clostridium tertium]